MVTGAEPMQTTPADLSDAMLDAAVELLGRSGGSGMVRVQGVSMLPMLRPGQRLAVEFSPARLGAGDLLLFRQGAELVVHRLLGRGGGARGPSYYRTRGDGVPRLDPPVDPANVVGRVTAVEQPAGWRDVRGRPARLYGRCLAWHDRFWSLVQHGASRLDPALERIHWRLRLRPRVAALDRGLLYAAHRLLFAAFHRRIPEPPGLAALAGPDAGEPRTGTGPAASR